MLCGGFGPFLPVPQLHRLNSRSGSGSGDNAGQYTDLSPTPVSIAGVDDITAGQLGRLCPKACAAVRDSKEFSKRINKVVAASNAATGHDIVAAIGYTGVGKSTTINWVRGMPLEVKDRKLVLKNRTEFLGAAQIGNGRDSQTTSCELYLPLPSNKDQDAKGDTRKDPCPVFLDVPGMGDNRMDPFLDFLNHVSIVSTIKKCKSVKLMLVLSYNLLNEPSTNEGHCEKTMKIAQAILGGQGFADFETNVCLCVTKVSLPFHTDICAVYEG